jgi:hypothetical protein
LPCGSRRRQAAHTTYRGFPKEKKMKSVKEIVQITGGWDRLRNHPLKIEVEGYLPLCIEAIGLGPHGGLLLSVMHVYLQHGDVMRDPDIEIEVIPGTDDWLPCSYRQDNLGLFREAVTTEDGVVRFDPGMVADLKQFLEVWDRNLREQGFVEAASRMRLE